MKSNFYNGYLYNKSEGQSQENHSQTQKQAYMQQLRSTEASAQMVYEVYGNVIAILEEVEQRELKSKSHPKQLHRSEIYLPNQSHKQDKDVTTILEAQLLLLQSQMRTCRLEIRDKVREQLLDSTLQWTAERHDQQLPTDHLTDHYAAQLIEILSTGSTNHPDKFRQSPGDVRGVTQKDMEYVIGAQHKTAELDRLFEDPTQKAKIPRIRSGDVRKGAERIRSTRSDLKPHLGRYEDDRMDCK